MSHSQWWYAQCWHGKKIPHCLPLLNGSNLTNIYNKTSPEMTKRIYGSKKIPFWLRHQITNCVFRQSLNDRAGLAFLRCANPPERFMILHFAIHCLEFRWCFFKWTRWSEKRDTRNLLSRTIASMVKWIDSWCTIIILWLRGEEFSVTL